MFEKRSHVNTSVSWGGCGAVWAQTPRQAKETDSSFALSCRLAEQAGPHQNRRPLQIFIISPLLTSLLIFPWNKRSHKVLIIPLSFHAVPGKRPKLAHIWYYQTQGTVFWHSCSGFWNTCPYSEVVPLVSHSQPCWDAEPFQWQPIVFSSFSHTGQKHGEGSGAHLVFGTLQNSGTPHPDLSHYANYHPPCTLTPERITLELLFPGLFIQCQSSFSWLFLRGIWRKWSHEKPP